MPDDHSPRAYITNVLRGRDRNRTSAGELADEILASLVRAGYVVVQPDDVPTFNPDEADNVGGWTYRSGWNACRRHILEGSR